MSANASSAEGWSFIICQPPPSAELSEFDLWQCGTDVYFRKDDDWLKAHWLDPRGYRHPHNTSLGLHSQSQIWAKFANATNAITKPTRAYQNLNCDLSPVTIRFLDVPLTAHAPHLSLVLQDFLADDSLYKPEGSYMMTHTAALAEMILSLDHRHSQERLPVFVNILATPSRIARCKPNYVTGLSDLGIFHIISMGEVIEESDLPTLSQQFKQPLGALKKEPYISTLITPGGYLTPPHVDAMSFCQLHTHFHGQKLWMCWLPTPHNLKWLRTHYPKGADEGTLLLAIAHLENLEIFHLDETVCSFLVPLLTIHAVVSLTTCTHFGITVFMEKFWDTSQHHFDWLDKCVEDVSTVGPEHVSFMLDSAVEELRVWKGVLKDGPRKQVTSVMRQKFAEERTRLSEIPVVED
ncbi:hypothetical protein K438DRAFT_1785641 [Mycena galopus ATCC 62051]|nr:hypothetical protein K438DRAFT_1785641 [Mycena galopus ATCC 62051]